jgi:hypothetical protein
MFKGIGQQTINSMMLEINECNKIVEWFIEETKISETVHSKLTLKSILKEEYFEEVSSLIVKSILYDRSASACIPVGRKPHQVVYDLLVIPKEEHMIIDIKRIT